MPYNMHHPNGSTACVIRPLLPELALVLALESLTLIGRIESPWRVRSNSEPKLLLLVFRHENRLGEPGLTLCLKCSKIPLSMQLGRNNSTFDVKNAVAQYISNPNSSKSYNFYQRFDLESNKAKKHEESVNVLVHGTKGGRYASVVSVSPAGHG